eukprot:CAMPEP_0113911874 /NCGR_PEP_ID=MMETSP0780_2-20120614/28527_1 /TAXON_ID=652834 /ORGANISM="Palpitomonas bilix" /LENGTH=229 /DNA_ID=CAMNT_0000908597 /DNA_START=339 /DNA_END=1028 /DNA_ORIENTATION=- /assembly_acc=CAM_ASM_000599
MTTSALRGQSQELSRNLNDDQPVILQHRGSSLDVNGSLHYGYVNVANQVIPFSVLVTGRVPSTEGLQTTSLLFLDHPTQRGVSVEKVILRPSLLSVPSNLSGPPVWKISNIKLFALPSLDHSTQSEEAVVLAEWSSFEEIEVANASGEEQTHVIISHVEEEQTLFLSPSLPLFLSLDIQSERVDCDLLVQAWCMGIKRSQTSAESLRMSAFPVLNTEGEARVVNSSGGL